METVPPTLFREYDVRGVADRELTAGGVRAIARALGTMVRAEGGRTVVVGRDCRLSSPRFGAEVIAGLRSTGCDVVDLGVVPTPLSSFAAHVLPGIDGRCMVTASHNPRDYNGLKLGLGTSTFFGERIQELRRVVEAGRFVEGQGTVVAEDVGPAYREAVRARVSPLARRLKVVVDAGNGTAGVVANPILRALGAEVIPLFEEMDGRFPNHHPDPTAEANLAALRTAVREHGADLGVAYDGDGDRLGAVDERGGILWGDQLLLLFARALLAERPGAAVVGEVKCSMTLFDEIARRGGRPVMCKAGHSIVRARMEQERAPLGGEMSGHLFFADRWYGFDDAIYASARLLELLSRAEGPLSALLADVPRTFSTPELHLACAEERKFEVVRRAQEWFASRYDTVTVDGVRVVFPDGWGLVRASNTQPLLVMRYEATTAERLGEIERLVGGRVRQLLEEVEA